MEVLERWSGWLGALLAVVVLVAVWQILWEDDRLEERDIRGRTPLIVAAEEGHVEKVRNLVGKGARIDAELNVQENENGQTALMWAVRNRNPELVRLLLSAGADTDIENREGQTAKDLAILASAGDECEEVTVIREALGCDVGQEN